MKIIATDFDGTLSYNGKISDEDKAAIKRFRDAGNKFGVVTGRDLEMSFWVRNSFPDCDFIISCTGAVICDNGGSVIYEKKQIADYKLRDIAEFAVSHGAGSFSVSDGLTRHYVDVRGKIPTDYSKIKDFNQCCTWFYNGENAQALVDKDAAVMILDAECKEKLAKEVTSLLNDEEKRSRMSANVLKMALRDADEKIVDTIYNILK